MKKNHSKVIVLLLIIAFILTGCTTQLKDSESKEAVKNPTTGQPLTENILCQPADEETREIYLKHGVKLDDLPRCDNFKVTSGGYEGLWTSGFVKPLAWFIIKIGELVKSNGLALILASIIIRMVMFPITRKTALQSELMKEAKPELDKLEKKYKDKTDNQSMQNKAMEMSAIYKKYKINPVSGCIFAVIQLPLLIAFLEAINRVPAIFEENFIGLQLGTTIMTGLSNANYVYIILILLVGATTYFSLKMNSASNPDNNQVKTMNKVMFVMIMIMSLFMSSALNIYWITTNMLTIIQNVVVKRKKV